MGWQIGWQERLQARVRAPNGYAGLIAPRSVPPLPEGNNPNIIINTPESLRWIMAIINNANESTSLPDPRQCCSVTVGELGGKPANQSRKVDLLRCKRDAECHLVPFGAAIALEQNVQRLFHHPEHPVNLVQHDRDVDHVDPVADNPRHVCGKVGKWGQVSRCKV